MKDCFWQVDIRDCFSSKVGHSDVDVGLALHLPKMQKSVQRKSAALGHHRSETFDAYLLSLSRFQNSFLFSIKLNHYIFKTVSFSRWNCNAMLSEMKPFHNKTPQTFYKNDFAWSKIIMSLISYLIKVYYTFIVKRDFSLNPEHRKKS